VRRALRVTQLEAVWSASRPKGEMSGRVPEIKTNPSTAAAVRNRKAGSLQEGLPCSVRNLEPTKPM